MGCKPENSERNKNKRKLASRNFLGLVLYPLNMSIRALIDKEGLSHSMGYLIESENRHRSDRFLKSAMAAGIRQELPKPDNCVQPSELSLEQGLVIDL